MFGCGILVAPKLWNILIHYGLLPDGGELKHLMWTLCFLKMYAKSNALAKLCGGANVKTIRKWNWQFIQALSNLEPYIIRIDWNNHFKGDTGEDCLMNVDGVDIFIPQHGKTFYSHKFKKSWLQYKLCTCIKTGDIVWVNGSYPCGNHNDIMIFRDSLTSHSFEKERVEADD
eukprot:11061212-Ditylum_brightwellii.AAC.1